MEPTLKPIDQQVIVITGASSGIALATAQEAISRGASVVASARSAADLQAFRVRVRRPGSSIAADVDNPVQVQRIAEHAITRIGRIDTWINKAGVSIYGRIQDITDADNRRLFDTNF